MYKLIALDLDGTLLTDSKEITKDNLDLIHLLVGKGYEIVIATGRSYYSARVLTKNINEHLIYMCHNGNIIRDSKDDRPISANYLTVKDSKIILQEGISRGLYPFIYVDFFEDGFDALLGRDYYSNESLVRASHNFIRIKIIEGQIEERLDRVLAMVYPGESNKLKDFYYSIGELYPDRFTSYMMGQTTQAERLLEIMSPLGNKWNAIVEYGESLGIKADEIIAMGDSNNDIEMITNAGLGIAMKNGNHLVKEAADAVSQRDNNESGVAFELKRVLGI